MYIQPGTSGVNMYWATQFTRLVHGVPTRYAVSSVGGLLVKSPRHSELRLLIHSCTRFSQSRYTDPTSFFVRVLMGKQHGSSRLGSFGTTVTAADKEGAGLGTVKPGPDTSYTEVLDVVTDNSRYKHDRDKHIRYHGVLSRSNSGRK